jgi:hypothetical protein
MRTQQQIDDIKSRFVEPFSVDNFLSNEEVEYLVNMYESHSDEQNLAERKVYKNTGPVTLNLKSYADDEVVVKILERLKYVIGPYEITASFFFHTNIPHIIHNDDLFQLPDGIYRAITFPLKFYRTVESDVLPNLCFFDQSYFQGPSKFFKGSEQDNIPSYYNQKLYDYSNVDGVLDYNAIDDETYAKLFTHLKREWLDGLSLKSYLPSKIGSALIFDSVRLHASSDFKKLGIDSKLAISIFTRYSPEIKENAVVNFYEVPGTQPTRSVY